MKTAIIIYANNRTHEVITRECDTHELMRSVANVLADSIVEAKSVLLISNGDVMTYSGASEIAEVFGV